MNEIELMDFNLQGRRFTWLSNPREGVITRQRIDHVLANWEWRENFPHALATALPIINSDHSPIILKPNPLLLVVNHSGMKCFGMNMKSANK